MNQMAYGISHDTFKNKCINQAATPTSHSTNAGRKNRAITCKRISWNASDLFRR